MKDKLIDFENKLQSKIDYLDDQIHFLDQHNFKVESMVKSNIQKHLKDTLTEFRCFFNDEMK